MNSAQRRRYAKAHRPQLVSDMVALRLLDHADQEHIAFCFNHPKETHLSLYRLCLWASQARRGIQ